MNALRTTVRLLGGLLFLAGSAACDSVPVPPSGPSPAPAPTGLTLPTVAPSIPSPLSSQGPITTTVLTGHLAGVRHLAWSPDGRLLASSTGSAANRAQDTSVRLWRADGTPLATLGGHSATITSLAWSPNSQTLASGSHDQTIRLWRSDGSAVRTLTGQAGTVWNVAWKPDGSTLAAAAVVTFTNPSIQLWHPDGTLVQTLHTLDSGGKFYNLAWSPDGRWLAGGATDYKLWRADGSEVAHPLDGTPSWALTWSPHSTRWVVGNESGVAVVYDTDGAVVATLRNSGNVDALAWSPDGQRVAGGDGVTFWQPDGRVLKTHPDLRGRVLSVAWSPDGHILASSGYDARVSLWRPDGTLLTTLTGHTAQINTLAWSPDGKILASASDDQTVRLWLVAGYNAP